MNTQRLHEILAATTVPLRKGATVTEKEVAGVNVTEVYAMPSEGEAEPRFNAKVDCHFISVGVDSSRASFYSEELRAILHDYPQPERLAGGPSYIEVGAVLGDQQTAFLLFAVGEVLGLWHVITPATVGLEGPDADQLAGSGFVMMSGFEEA